MRLFPEFVEKIKRCVIENRDWAEIIKRYDSKKTFFYLDPPYPGTDIGGYAGGFSFDDFEKMMKILRDIKGRYLFSSFADHVKKEHRVPFSRELSRPCSAGMFHRGAPKKKTEFLGWNFQLKKQNELF